MPIVEAAGEWISAADWAPNLSGVKTFVRSTDRAKTGSNVPAIDAAAASHRFPRTAHEMTLNLFLSMTLMDRGGLWTLGGFLLLGWVLARMTIHRRKNRVRQRQEDRDIQRRIDSTNKSALPLSDAPPETQRWQVAMFDLQRELKGELDSRIAVTQSLIRQLDQRIATIEQIERRSSQEKAG